MMKPLPTALLAWLCAGALAVGAARADEFAEVQRLHAGGESAAALQRAEKFLAGKPNDAQMRFEQGVLLAEAKRSSEATQVFQRLIEDCSQTATPARNAHPQKT